MPRRGFETGSQYGEPEEKQPRTGLSRRALLKAAAAGAALLGTPYIVKEGVKLYEKFEADNFRENVEKEKAETKRDVAQGIENERAFETLLNRYNELVGESEKFDEHSEKFRKLQEEGRAVWVKLQDFYVDKGNHGLGPLAEATPYAETLLTQDAALINLAMIRVLYEKNAATPLGNRELPYWHNCTLAYLELANVPPGQIMKKFGALLEYVEEHKMRLADISPEQILYAFVDGAFDFSLKASEVQAALNNIAPNWESYPATHTNKDSYAHYNDLSVLDVFELNRLQAVLTQLQSPAFRGDVFQARDEDLRHRYTEFGGVIPRPEKENRLRVIPAKTEDRDGAYVVPAKAVVELFVSAATFHFHATQAAESTSFQGPSGSDTSFFGPGVVFTSLSDSEVLVHFYASRAKRRADYDLQVTNEVVCLGSIRQGQ